MDFNFDTSTIDVSGVSGQTLNISGNGALQLPSGADGTRGTAVAGKLRWNTASSRLEVAISGAAWSSLQFYSQELDGISSLSVIGMVARTGTGTYAARTLTAPAAGFSITNASGQAGNPTFVLANDLAAVEALSTNGFAVRTAADTWTTRSISGTASNISVSGGDGSSNVVIDLINAGTPIADALVRITTDAKGRVTSSSAVSSTNITTALGYTPISRTGDSLTAGHLTLFQDPTSDMHAATKRYVDQRASGLDPKGSVRAASGENINVSAPGASIGGVTLSVGNRVLLKDQTNQAQNGIYVWNGAAVPMTRASDADSNDKVTSGMYVFVSEGSFATQGWILTTPDPITVGTTGLAFSQFNGSATYSASNGISLSGSDIRTDTNSLLRGLHTLASNGIIVKTGTNTVVNRTISVPTGMSIANGDGVSGNPTISLANDLAGLEGLGSTGFAVRTATDTWQQRWIYGTGAQIAVANSDGVSGDPTISIASDVALPGSIGMVLPSGTNAQETGTTNGGLRFNTEINRLRQRFGGNWSNVGTGDGTVSSVTVSAGTGMSVSNPTVTSTGTISLSLNAELQGLAGLAGTGLLVRSGAGTYTQRSLVAGTGISVTNGNGVSGNITVTNTGVTEVGLSLPSQFTLVTSSVTTTGTLTATWANQTANTVFAGPASGGAATPGFRALSYTDLPLALVKENPSSPSTNTTGGNNSVVIGHGGNARVTGEFVHASGQFSGNGDAQAGNYVLRNSTTNATPTELFLDGSSSRLELPNNSAFMVTVMVVGRRTNSAGGYAAHKHELLIVRDATAATTTIIGNDSKTVVAETDAAWDSNVTADSTNGALRIMVTGKASETIRWVARVMTVEVTN